ncbi:MAG: hypothetical protein WC770_01215 [Phycisphaerae bacterium]|jgi:hypothetical protein
MARYIILLFITACLISGCAKRQHFEPKPICLTGMDANSVMLEAEKALIRMDFVIEKFDVDSGIVRTKPLAGGQFLEVWRQDNRGGYNSGMANLHSIQRTAELRFSENNGQMCINCNVKLERLSIPEKEIDSSARAYAMFSESREGNQTLRLNEEQKSKMDWVNLGRDNSLEAYILKKVEKRLNNPKKGKK